MRWSYKGVFVSDRLKVKVYGGCVSRDILNFDTSESTQLAGYNARSSIATLAVKNAEKKIANKYYQALSNIESNFQRRMVKYDFDNEILKSASIGDYDFLLIDLLVDRFHLAEVDGKLVTRSVEFVRSGIKPDKVINTFSDQYMTLWKEGLDNLFSVVSDTVGLDAVKLNKVYWSSVANTPEDTELLNTKWDIEKNNDKLNTMYQYIEDILPSSSIIEVDKHLLVADSNHKWGVSPFHFTDAYYRQMVLELKNSSN